MTDAPDMAAWHAKNAAEMIAATVRELVERDGYRAEQAEGLAILAGLFFDPASVPHAMRRLVLTIESVLSDGARVAAMVRFDQLARIAVAMERELALGDATECVRARLILERSEITAELTEMIRADLLAHVLVEPAAGGMARATLRLAPEVSLYPARHGRRAPGAAPREDSAAAGDGDAAQAGGVRWRHEQTAEIQGVPAAAAAAQRQAPEGPAASAAEGRRRRPAALREEAEMNTAIAVVASGGTLSGVIGLRNTAATSRCSRRW
jgi:hypothetical protein